jgi:hypothetical protein
MQRKKVFITFGGPTPKYHRAVSRICSEMQQFQYFDQIKGFTDHYLKSDTVFWKKHGNFLENNPRGYGYWIWKSYLIQKTLSELNDDDILIYADAGCVGNINGKPRLMEYVDMLDNDPNQYGIITFRMSNYVDGKEVTGCVEEYWTKKKIFEELECDDSIRKSGQCMATIVIIKKTKHSVDIINKWVENMKYELINDSLQNEDPWFKDNRHDQSIYSCIVKKHGSIDLMDETYYLDWNEGNAIPILARRNIW